MLPEPSEASEFLRKTVAIALLFLPLCVASSAAQEGGLWPTGNDYLSRAWNTAFSGCAADGFEPLSVASDTSAVLCGQLSQEVARRVYLRSIQLKDEPELKAGVSFEWVVEASCGQEQIVTRNVTIKDAKGQIRSYDKHERTYVRPGMMWYQAYRLACPK